MFCIASRYAARAFSEGWASQLTAPGRPYSQHYFAVLATCLRLRLVDGFVDQLFRILQVSARLVRGCLGLV